MLLLKSIEWKLSYIEKSEDFIGSYKFQQNQAIK